MKSASISICFSPDRTQILAVKRRDVPIWVLPGGAIDANETVEEAASRELREETGVSNQPIRLIATYHPINRLASTTYLVECIYTSGTPAPQDETSSCGFFPVDNLPTPFFFLHEEWIRDALNATNYFEKKITSVTWRRFLHELIRHPTYILRYLYSRIMCRFKLP